MKNLIAPKWLAKLLANDRVARTRRETRCLIELLDLDGTLFMQNRTVTRSRPWPGRLWLCWQHSS